MSLPSLSIVSLAILFILVVGTILYAVKAIYDFYMQRQIEKVGLVTDGKIVNLSQRYSNAKTQLETEFFINYSFGIGILGVDQKLFYGSQRVAETIYNKMGIGDQIEVIYLPKNPNISRLVDDNIRHWQTGKN